MWRMNNGFQGNLIVDKIMENWNDMMADINIQELCERENLVLIRSAREEVVHNLLECFSVRNYTGYIHLIGRRGDEKYRSEYPGLHIDLYVVDDCEKYTVENTKEYVDRLQVDAICFLYQSSISFNHNNLLWIVEQAGCQGYAVSRNLQAVKFKAARLHDYLRGKAVYDELCDWFYDTKKGDCYGNGGRAYSGLQK